MQKAWIYVKKGRLRRKVMLELDEAHTATELAKKLRKHRSSVSRTLLDLAKKRLVACINPEDDRERHYQLTLLGKKVRNKLKA
jgi:DNA-binding MarR family transcriptional regulator